MRVQRIFASCVAMTGGLYGCSSEGTGRPDGLQIAVAPLNLPGIDHSCFDLRVGNGTDTVWSQGDPLVTAQGHDQNIPGGTGPVVPPLPGDAGSVCSDQYGNTAGGDISYVGPCDASTDSDAGLPGVQNSVTLWVDGLYNASDADIGEWQDPCGASGCTLQVDCNENEDSLVTFNLTIMRQANQGFFDIAVNFEDVFCSAKVDCEYADGGDIDLLFNEDDDGNLVRDDTLVFAFACTAGPGSDTHLYLDEFEIYCSQNGTEQPIDPSAGPGNVYPDPAVGQPLWQYAVYEGTEQLPGLNKVYWNVALGISMMDLAGDYTEYPTMAPNPCWLTTTATVSNGPWTNGEGPANATYPAIAVNVLLNPDGKDTLACGTNPLNGDGSGVQTVYSAVNAPLCFDNGLTANFTNNTVVTADTNPSCTDYANSVRFEVYRDGGDGIFSSDDIPANGVGLEGDYGDSNFTAGDGSFTVTDDGGDPLIASFEYYIGIVGANDGSDNICGGGAHAEYIAVDPPFGQSLGTFDATQYNLSQARSTVVRFLFECVAN